jgi:hypothetical protein
MAAVSPENGEATLRSVLARMRRSFPAATIAPPIAEANLRTLTEACGRLHPGYVELLRICDGIDVGVEDDYEGRLLGSAQVVHIVKRLRSDRALVPLRADGAGDFDCVVCGSGVGYGSVVFWDHETSSNPRYLLGSSIAAYLRMWTDWLVKRYRRDGGLRWRFRSDSMAWAMFTSLGGLDHPWPFKEHWLRKHDPDAARMLDDPALRQWLAPRGKEWNWKTLLRAFAGKDSR